MAVAKSDEASAQSPKWESIEELFAALESPLLNYAIRLVGSRAPAEDIVQDAFMKLHAQFHEIREPRHWLYRTVHNLALNHRRKEGRTVPLHPAPNNPQNAPFENPDPQPLPDEQIARWEGIGLVRLSLQSLDARSRELVHLKFHENLSYKEMSARTGLTVSHVGYLLHNALKSIAAELSNTGVIP